VGIDHHQDPDRARKQTQRRECAREGEIGPRIPTKRESKCGARSVRERASVGTPLLRIPTERRSERGAKRARAQWRPGPRLIRFPRMSMACSFGAPCSSAFGLRLLSISLLTHCRQCYGALALAHNRALLRQHLDLALFL
jgi:hypothetical protein